MGLTVDQINKWELEEELLNKDEAPEFFEDGKLIDEYRMENDEKERDDQVARAQVGADFAFALIQINKLGDLSNEEELILF